MDSILELIGDWAWLIFFLIITLGLLALAVFIAFEFFKKRAIEKRRAKKTRPEVIRRYKKMKKRAQKRKEAAEKLFKHEAWVRLRAWRTLRQPKSQGKP